MNSESRPPESNPVEERLRTSLGGVHASLSSSASDPQWSDLSRRIDKKARSTRSSAGAIALTMALCAGTGGYFLGRQSKEVSEVSTASSGSARSGSSAATTRLIRRTTASGVEIALEVSKMPKEAYVTTPNQLGVMPSECMPDESGSLFLLDTQGVSTAYMSISNAAGPQVNLTESYRNSAMTEMTSSDQPQVPPRAYMIATVSGAGSAEVSATFPGGAVDSMKTSDGLAVLAVPFPELSDDEWATLKDFSVTIESGGKKQVVPVRTLSLSGPMRANSPEEYKPLLTGREPDCTLQLPEPGEQPADVESAQAAVLYAFGVAYEGTQPLAERLVVIDDPTGVEAAIQQVSVGSFSAAMTGTKFVSDGLVFISPTEAVVKYHLVLPAGLGPTELSGRLGKATLIDGVWKVSRATLCGDLSMGGGYCDGDQVNGGYPMAPTTTAGFVVEGSSSEQVVNQPIPFDMPTTSLVNADGGVASPVAPLATPEPGPTTTVLAVSGQ